jgi:hypothetical protein
MFYFLSALCLGSQDKTFRLIWVDWFISPVPINWCEMIESSSSTNIRFIFFLHTTLLLMIYMTLNPWIECHWVSPLVFHEYFTVSNLNIARVINPFTFIQLFGLLGGHACLKIIVEVSLPRDFQFSNFLCAGCNDLGDSLVLHCLI